MSKKQLDTVVIKIGTSVVTDENGKINTKVIHSIVEQIAKNREKAKNFVIVTSGAIACGISKLKLNVTPDKLSLNYKQMCAAVGQPILMNYYSRYFERHGILVAQVLLTEEDLANKYRYENLWKTLKTFFSRGIIPILNENDTLSVKELVPVNPYVPEEVRFGDNDRLSAIIASKIRADLLIILTNVDGFMTFNKNGKATLVKEIKKINNKIKSSIGSGSKFGRGGMKTKLEAAIIAKRAGVKVVIANGKKRNTISKVLLGERGQYQVQKALQVCATLKATRRLFLWAVPTKCCAGLLLS
ncbi:MAG: glutamate 5-kinase, partial [Candidatus Brockarchaeota archaeon]|nr:glutamate 5-kinase [Candidatus Brockarchaeota archaeon]